MQQRIGKSANLMQEACMLNIGQDIYPLSDFKRKSNTLIQQMKKTRRPVVLTLNGRAEVVVQDASAYQMLLSRLEECESALQLVRAPREFSS
jgi:prevent-host-death family protein